MLDFQKKLTNTFYAVLTLPATAMGFALSIQISALSWLMSTKYGLDIHEVGIVWAAGPLAGIFGQVIFGLISDKTWFWGGRRRPFILIGGVLAALMLLALPNIGTISETIGIGNIMITALFIALTLDIAINISFNPTRSIISDVTPEGVPRTKGYTWMQTVSGLFGVVAYVIGAVFDKYMLIYFGVGLVLAFTIIPILFVEEPRDIDELNEENPERKDPITALVLSFALPGIGFFYLGKIVRGILYLLVAAAAYGLAFYLKGTIAVYMDFLLFAAAGLIHLLSIIFSYRLARWMNINNPNVDTEAIDHKTDWPQLMRVYVANGFSWLGAQTMFIYIFAYISQVMMGYDGQTGLSEAQNSQVGQIIDIAFIVMYSIGFLLPVLVLEPITEKIGRVKTHAASMAFMALGFFCIVALGKTPWVLYILMVVVGIGWAAQVSLPFAIMSEKVNKNRMGFFMGIFNLSIVIPQLIASLVIGYIVQEVADKNIIFIISGICLTLSAIMWLLVKEKMKGEIYQPDPIPASEGPAGATYHEGEEM